MVQIFETFSEILKTKLINFAKRISHILKKHFKNGVKFTAYGLIIGIINGLFGAGGGIAAVEVLKRNGLDQRQAQTTSISIILPLCVLSAILYSFKTDIDFKTTIILIPFGILGTFLGTFLMKKMSCELLKKIFCGFMIYAGVRMFFKG